MKTHGKRLFSLLLAAALVLPVFCALPASASSRACNHVFGQYTLVGTEWETSSSGHTLVETKYPVCSVCGWINKYDPKVTRTPGSHSWKDSYFVSSNHAGKYMNHTFLYHGTCQVCGYKGSYTTSSGCNANGCALDPAAVAPSIK